MSWSKFPEQNGEESKARIKRQTARVLVFFPVTIRTFTSSLKMGDRGEEKT